MRLALQISAIGMVLVFLGLILLWWMMAALVRLTRIKEKPPFPAQQLSSDVPPPHIERQRKAAAVAAAVAVRVAIGMPVPSRPDRAIKLTPWQAAHRVRQITNQPPVFRRKD